MLKQVLLLLIVSGCGAVAIAQTQPQQTIYKWIDDQGKLQYSELAPPPGVAGETVRKPTGATPGESAPKQSANQGTGRIGPAGSRAQGASGEKLSRRFRISVPKIVKSPRKMSKCCKATARL
ncbi:MAG: DUF4124 domain-containing protein [Candidatus Competibacteraceae bacterium]|nr:DUF4124 domain-containing protein [Candidatus Competibacteraceae bacterium]